ncbi:MAG: VOC family protein [Congregibacter sp.]
MPSLPSPVPFHLALPVDDLEAAAVFYGEVLGCSRSRSSPKWIDYDFFGHQLTVHKVKADDLPAVARNAVDGDAVPASHFGPILSWDDWAQLQARLRSSGIEYTLAPKTRFEGRRGEQKTCFLRDPAGNYLEFKCFRNPDMLFANDDLDYA